MRLFILLSRLVKTSLRTLLGPAVSTTKATKRAFKKIRRAAATVEKTVEDLTDAAEKAASTATELSTHLAPAPVPAPIIVPSPATVTPTTRRETLVQEALATVARRRLYVARATDRNQLAAVYMSDSELVSALQRRGSSSSASSWTRTKTKTAKSTSTPLLPMARWSDHYAARRCAHSVAANPVVASAPPPRTIPSLRPPQSL